MYVLVRICELILCVFGLLTVQLLLLSCKKMLGRGTLMILVFNICYYAHNRYIYFTRVEDVGRTNWKGNRKLIFDYHHHLDELSK